MRGNCDSEVDQMIIAFPILSEYTTILDEKRRFFLSHGHIWCPEKLPPVPTGTILVNGHTHVSAIEQIDSGVIYFNPGSISLPKNDQPPSFGLYDGRRLSVLNLDGAQEILALELPA